MVIHRLPLPRKAPEIDVVAVRAMAARFAMHHRQRYLDALGKLDGRKREILAALPMFFHCNHPLLPGYLPEAPAGIVGHVPTGSDIAAIHRFARGFDASLRPSRQDIDAIFLMGSGGSLGHTADSDIDLWVCCDMALHEALQPKLRSIEQWALAHGLAVQGFLVDPLFFHNPEESVHSPLLLDEFYRSGIHLTGKAPLWWYVSGTTTTEYTQSAADIYAIRLVTEESVLDFGPVGQPDLATLCRAGMSELERALETPHKSLLKLALVESYLNHPDRPLLSSHYHQLMRSGINDTTRLDTYYMLYHFLDASGSQRLTTFNINELRQLFVRKIVSRAREIPRSSQLAAEIRSWGFSDEMIQRLRHPARMPLAAVLSEVSLTGELLRKGARFGRRLAMLAPATREALIAIENSLSRFAEPADPVLRPMNRALLPDIRPGLEVRRVRHQWRLVEENHVLRSADS
jgi:adenylate cyclase class 1